MSIGTEVNISFENVSVSLRKWNRSTKQILHSLSGQFPSGKLIGILGPSGAGKSTLLNFLSGFKLGQWSGNVYVNGSPRDLNNFKKISRYIAQENVLNESLTVEENIKFAIDFKLGQSISGDDKKQVLEATLDIFGLQGVREVRTGKISGGELKRLSVALEVVDNPNVMFLDEPTTGLDSLIAQRCVEYLKKLTNYGKTLIFTIHQPSAAILNLIDVIYVMSSGNCLYHGTVKQLVPFLQEVGLPCNVNYNPADYIVDIANYDFGMEAVEILLNSSLNGKNFIGGNNENEDESLKQIVDNDVFRKVKAKTIQSSFLYEMSVMLRREYHKLVRNMFLTHLRTLAMYTNAILIAILLRDIFESDSQIWSLMSVYGSICTDIVMIGFTGAMFTFLIFPLEIRILKREHFNQYYSLLSYYLSITLLDIPLTIFVICGSSLIRIYTIGVTIEPYRILIFLLAAVVTGFASQAIGLLLGSIFNNIVAGLFLGGISIFGVMLFSGFGFGKMPWYFEYVPYFCFLRYSLLLMLNAVIGFNQQIPCPETNFCYFTDGSDFLKIVDAFDESVLLNFFAIVFICVFLRVVTYVVLLLRVRR